MSPRDQERWRGVFRDGPMCFTSEMIGWLESYIDLEHRVPFRILMEHVQRDAEYAQEVLRSTKNEVERIRAIGRVLLEAGMQSYTDKDGRIYVAARGDR